MEQKTFWLDDCMALDRAEQYRTVLCDNYDTVVVETDGIDGIVVKGFDSEETK